MRHRVVETWLCFGTSMLAQEPNDRHKVLSFLVISQKSKNLGKYNSFEEFLALKLVFVSAENLLFAESQALCSLAH